MYIAAKQLIAASRDNGGIKRTKTILVKNVPASADEELLEVFFESTKKQGGGPVNSVKMHRDKNVAFVEFCESASVERVLSKRPIKLGTTELDIESYEPLLQGSEKINRMDCLGLPATFTDGLLKEQLDSLLSTQTPLIPHFSSSLSNQFSENQRVSPVNDVYSLDIQSNESIRSNRHYIQ